MFDEVSFCFFSIHNFLFLFCFLFSENCDVTSLMQWLNDEYFLSDFFFFVSYGSWNGLLIIPHFFNNIYFVFLFYFLSVINWFTKGCVAVNFCWLVPAPSLCLWYILGFFDRELRRDPYFYDDSEPALLFRRSSSDAAACCQYE